jgi:conjugal transfer pilus assembly protein TrbC
MLLLAGAILASTAHADNRWPDPADIAKALRDHPFPDVAPLRRPVPRIDATPAGIDLEALARQGARLPTESPTESAPKPASTLRIFVTLDMPAASLRLLAAQAARIGAPLVLRGLKDRSMRATLAAIGRITGTGNAGWLIDPDAFTRFGIAQAPTFVVTEEVSAAPSCTGTCRAGEDWTAISGDVSVDYAIEAILRQKPALAPRLKPLLARLRPS